MADRDDDRLTTVQMGGKGHPGYAIPERPRPRPDRVGMAVRVVSTRVLGRVAAIEPPTATEADIERAWRNNGAMTDRAEAEMRMARYRVDGWGIGRPFYYHSEIEPAKSADVGLSTNRFPTST